MNPKIVSLFKRNDFTKATPQETSDAWRIATMMSDDKDEVDLFFYKELELMMNQRLSNERTIHRTETTQVKTD